MPLKQVLNIYAVYLIHSYSWYNINLRCKFRTETNLVLVIFRKPKLKE